MVSFDFKKMDKIVVNGNFELPSGVKFKKGEVFYGTWDYWSPLRKTPLDLVVICNEHRGPFLLPKENFLYAGSF